MRLMSLQELQKCEFDILVDFQSFCDENNLRYYLGGGTLIGAIRHKGFIPWDDDIDIMMPRPDYDRFLALNPTGKLNDRINIDSMIFNDSALSAVTRLYDIRTEITFTRSRSNQKFGCWIDIFPIDGLEDSEKRRYIHFKKARIIMDLQILSGTKMGTKRRNKVATVLQYFLIPILPFVHSISQARWNKMMDKLARKCSYETAKYVGVLEGRAGEKEAMLKDRMEPAVYVDFWGRKFTAMANYDEYLTNLYGDYMTPPSVNDRVSRHEIKIYWKEKVD